ncbi:MAG: hypothetical protein JJT76_11055 [Clostridiaceae bacterium]|nr:hypothetical protein [Clostridiaceae bacterium]
MNKKRVLILFLVFVMIASVLTACSSPKSARETLEEALLNETEINTSQFKVSFSLNVDASTMQDPQFGFIASMVNNARITVEGMADADGKKASAQISLSFGGMAFNGEVYYFDNKFAVKLPFLAQILGDSSFAENYIVMDADVFMEELSPYQQQVEYEEEEILEVYRKIITTSLEVLSDNAIVDKGQQDITVGTKNLKAREIEIAIDQVEIKALIKNLMSMLEDDQFRDIAFDIVSTMDPYMTREVFDGEVNNMLEEIEDFDMDEMFQEMGKVIDMDNFYIKSNIYLDDTPYVVKYISEIAIGLREGEDFINIRAKGEGDTWNINQSLDIDTPDIHEGNSIDFFDLVMRMMFNSYF